jgi:hypothetical protein
MKQQLGPEWSAEARAAGERFRQGWEEVFSGGPAENPMEQLTERAPIAGIRARHETELLRYPNVVAVDEGIRTRAGKPTGERCLVVYVKRKLPLSQLSKEERLPTAIEGVPIDVVDAGEVVALSQDVPSTGSGASGSDR